MIASTLTKLLFKLLQHARYAAFQPASILLESSFTLLLWLMSVVTMSLSLCRSIHLLMYGVICRRRWIITWRLGI